MLNFKEEFVSVGSSFPDAESVIRDLADRLFQAGMVGEDYGKATITRESQHATGLPTRPFPIAFPHADADGVEESALAVAILETPVSFRNMADPDEELPVEIVIMLANKSPEEQVQTLRSLAELFGEADKLVELRGLSDAKTVVDWLSGELRLTSSEQN